MGLLDGLSLQQKEAVQSDKNVVIIIAGPGTGKTRTLTAKVQYLVHDKHIEPASLLALTFTKKAAQEMRERLSGECDGVAISTFHALAYDELVKNRKVRIGTERELTECVKQVIADCRAHKIQISVKEVEKIIALRNGNCTNDKSKFVLSAYDRIKSEKDIMDYDDLLIEYLRIVKARPPQYAHILVDEFQDTNMVQYEILTALTKHRDAHLFVIGDPRQSVYGFRGADPHIFSRLLKDYSSHHLIELIDNYRSYISILKSAHLIFPEMPSLLPHSNNEGEVCIVSTVNTHTEAEYIKRTIMSYTGGLDLISAQKNTQQNCCSFKDIAILGRTHDSLRRVADALYEASIPYQLVTNATPFTELEVQLIVLILNYLVEPNEENLLLLFQSKLLQHFDRRVLVEKWVKEHKQKDLLETMHNVKRFVADTFTISEKGEKEFLYLLSLAIQFFGVDDSLKKFANYMNFLADHEYYDLHADRVTIATFHAAKGLEFDHVIVCGFNEGVVPLTSSATDQEEEKRLFYVALTRAKKTVVCTAPRKRGIKPTPISRYAAVLSPIVKIQEDEGTAVYLKQLKKRQEKRSQMQMF